MKGFFCGFGADDGPQSRHARPEPGIHVLAAATKNVDGRDIYAKTRFALLPGHDDW
jgi:hypothetical protein